MKVIAVLSLSVLASSCGNKSSDETSSKVITNSSASATGSTSIDAITDSLSEGSNTTLGFTSTNANNAGDVDYTVTKACSADSAAKTATVKLTRSGTGTRTVTRGRWSLVSTITASGTDTRTWTPASGQAAITCVGASAGASIAWGSDTAVNGVKLTSVVDKSLNIDVTATNSVTSATRTSKRSSSQVGSRTVTWTAPSSQTAVSGSILRDKTVEIGSSIVASSQTYADGTVQSVSGTISTATDAPLKVTVQRAATSPYNLEKKTIHSGTVTAVASDGVVTTLAMSGLVYDLATTNTKKCVPTAGTITGTVYTDAAAATAGNATKTFIITFGATSSDTSATISYDSGTADEYDYTASGCDIEREANGL